MRIRDNDYLLFGLDLLVKVLIIVAITLIITFFLSRFFFETPFVKLLENMAMVLILIGAASLFGGSKIRQNTSYNLSKLTIGANESAKRDLQLWAESYSFCVMLGLSAIIVLVISYAFWSY